MIRKVGKQDLDILFEWINDEEVVKNSRYQKRKTINQFKMWINQMIQYKDAFMYILEVDDVPVGQINFEIDESEAVLTYSVDKDHRGKGLGKKLVSNVESIIKNDKLQCNRISAYINANNIASIKVFESLGYEYEIDEVDYKKLTKEIK